MDANLNVIRDYIENSYGNNSGRNAARAAVDALSQQARPVPHHQRLGEALSEYFGKLDSIEGIRAPEGRILRAFDYCDSRNLDDLIDRAILPALAASIEQHEAAPADRRHVGDSKFEGWYQAYAAKGETNPKQIARDAYAAGMGDMTPHPAPSAPLEGTGNGADERVPVDTRITQRIIVGSTVFEKGVEMKYVLAALER